MKPASPTLALLAALGAFSCGRAQDSAPESPSSTAPEHAESARPPCPLGFEGVVLSVDDVEGGVVIGFSGAEAIRDELRARVRDVSMMRGAGAHQGKGHDGGHFGSQVHGLRLTTLPPATATVEDTDAGAKLRLEAAVHGQVEGLREQGRERAAVVSRAPCTL